MSDDNTPTLSEVVDQWYDHIQSRVDLAPSTIQTYGRASDHLVTWGAGRPLGVVDLSEYVLWRRRANMAPRTIALELRIANAMFTWARKENVVTADADLRIPRLKIDRRRFVLNHHTPTPGEAGKAIEAMPSDDWKLAALLLARTGARVGEVVHLRGRDLDEPGGRVAFGATDDSCKTGLRWFPLDEGSRDMLRGRSDRGDDPMFDFEQVTAPIQVSKATLSEVDRALGEHAICGVPGSATAWGVRATRSRKGGGGYVRRKRAWRFYYRLTCLLKAYDSYTGFRRGSMAAAGSAAGMPRCR